MRCLDNVTADLRQGGGGDSTDERYGGDYHRISIERK